MAYDPNNEEDNSYDPDILIPVTQIVLHWESGEYDVTGEPSWAFSASGTRPSGDTVIVDNDGPLSRDPNCSIQDLLVEAYKRLEEDNCPPPIETLPDFLWTPLPLDEGKGWYWTAEAHEVPYEMAES